MSALLEFLIENPVDNLTAEVIVPPRSCKMAVRDKGDDWPRVRGVSKSFTKIGGKKKVEFDSKKFNELVVLNHTIEPNSRDAESIKKAGCSNNLKVLI